MKTRQLTRSDLPRKTSGSSLGLKVIYEGLERKVADIHFGDDSLCYLEGGNGEPVKIADLGLILKQDFKKLNMANKDNYYIIYFGEDGMNVKKGTKADVEKLLKDLAEEEMEHPAEKFAQMKDGESLYMDGNYPLYKYLIIKGEEVFPKAVQTVTEFKID